MGERQSNAGLFASDTPDMPRIGEEAFVAYDLPLQQTLAGSVDNWRRSSVRDRGGDDEGRNDDSSRK